MVQKFIVGRLPRILFGSGVVKELVGTVRQYGQRALILTGGRSFRNSTYWKGLCVALHENGIYWQTISVTGEPSPQFVDDEVRNHRDERYDVVVGIGGGSVLDASKAIAGLLLPGNSVMDHLEGVGSEMAYRGPTTPFIAVPTTAGTG
jgi:alcohol dehydrogenase class IV